MKKNSKAEKKSLGRLQFSWNSEVMKEMQTFEIKISFGWGQWIKKTSSWSKQKYTRNWINHISLWTVTKYNYWSSAYTVSS